MIDASNETMHTAANHRVHAARRLEGTEAAGTSVDGL
jgi:hypothetical protein